MCAADGNNLYTGKNSNSAIEKKVICWSEALERQEEEIFCMRGAISSR